VEARWEVQQLRVTIFPSKPIPVTPEIWQALAGSLPETETKRPRDGSTLLAGVVDGIQIVISNTPAQFDVLFGPQPPVAMAQTLAALPRTTIGEVKTVFEMIRAKVPVVFDFVPESARIAFAGTVLLATEDVKDSYNKLATLLHSVEMQPTKVRDFYYRVNWPLTVDGVDINRLTTWSAVVVRTMSVADVAHSAVSDSHYAQLEFDINTVPSPAKFSSAELRQVFPTLVALVEENLERGEVVPQ
jgi:hypothetical protein